MKTIPQITLSICAVFALAYSTAHAAKITSFSPQGEITQVRQVSIKFDEAMVPMGDPNAAAPIILECEPATTSQGQGRWVDEKNWVFDFSQDLAPGVRCTAKIVETLKSINDNIYSGPIQYRFNTGGPFVRSIRPWEYQSIAEDQAFILLLNGDATAQSIKKHVWCTSSSVGERIPVKLIEGEDRNALMKIYGWDKASQEKPDQYWVVQCQRRFNANDRVRLIYDVGVETPTGIGNTTKKTFSYNVREEFKANFSCTRENAQANCMPLAEMRLSFSAPLTWALAEQIRLKTEDGQEFKPTRAQYEQNQDSLTNVFFSAPFPEKTKFTIVLPSEIQDLDARKLANADRFPLHVTTDQYPVLAKFAAAPFGLVELYTTPDEPPMIPLTVRNIESVLNVAQLGLPANRGTLSQIRYTEDADIIRWLNAVNKLHEGWISYEDLKQFAPNAIYSPQNGRDWGVQTRTVSLLGKENAAQKIDLPQTDPDAQNRATEVIGIPLKTPGYHVLELASPALGKALLQAPNSAEGADGASAMYVRTGVLVTNLAVHAKIGRENSLVWVTRLNDGLPVQNAEVNIRDCTANLLFTGKTDENGTLNIDKQLSGDNCPYWHWNNALFISARAQDEKALGGVDMTFTLSSWDRGIESWRFGYPQNYNLQPSGIATTVFDRTLLRAGETVSMKHFIRDLHQGGFAAPETNIDTVKIVHQGSGQESVIPIEWKEEHGGFSASTSFDIPDTAKLGTYRVFLINKDSAYHDEYYYYENDRDVFLSGSFQVEEFRLPVFEGSIHIASEALPLVKPKEVPLSLQVNYLSGGGASELPVQISAVVRDYSVNFPDYQHRFSFTPPAPDSAAAASRADGYDDGYEDYQDNQAAATAQKLIADKLPLKLDRNGAGSLTLSQMPTLYQAQELLVEASFADPNGEIVTLRRNTPLWPAEVVAGIRNDEWVSITNSKISLQAIALDTQGKPKTGVPIEIRAQERITLSTRKRLVGGFYAYDSKTELRDLGSICSGQSDEHGLLTCEHQFTVGGNIELIAIAKDEQGRASSATTSLWITSRDELWFGGSDSDRIDLLPENKTYQTGDTARFQLRMPFRQATALVTVEREGILESHVMQLAGNNPTIELQVKETWGPNVYVSALVLRGRLHDVPLYTLFDWGYKNGDQWWVDYQNGLDYAPPTAMVDLSKPAYRLGVAEIKVTDPAYTLGVSVSTEKPVYQVRDKAKATITVLFPDGKPAANADVAIAVVDEALLELKKNNSWNLLESMLKRRSWGVQTSTAQMEVVGRRHYGRKAIPAGGGGGGGNSARELFDTLLLWQPYVKLDANGQATLEIPVNDSLTTFRVVAIAAEGVERFGTGFTKFQTTQDLQLISGLPPVIRSDDDFRAAITLRNATQSPMKVEVSAKATSIDLATQTLEIPANSAREAVWNIKVPAELAGAYEGLMDWEIQAKDLLGGATDSIITSQRVLTGVPITVRQATLKQLDGTLELAVKQPADGIPGRGGIQVSMVPRLADGLPAIEAWFRRYPEYQSLETKVSRTLGTRDAQSWTALARQIPDYLDTDGLAYYYIPRPYGSQISSTVLTAYILSSAHEAAKLKPELALPSSLSDQMLSGLAKFVEGKIQRNPWAPIKDLEMRRLNAMEALSRYGKFKPAMLGNITISPNQWPTTGVIQWMQLLQRTPTIENRDARLEEAQQILRARLNVAGTRMGFSTEKDDYWWWMMWNADQNAAYLLLATLDEPQWQEELPKLVTGFIARQQTGAWHTTTSNLWGGFALEQFSRKFESIPVTGFTQIKMVEDNGSASSQDQVDWSQVKRADRHNNIGTDAPSSNSYFGAPSAAASFVNNSVFLPWQASTQPSTVILTQDGTGRPWATIQSLAAVPLKAPFAAGYNVTKTVTPINEQVKGKVTRGDIWRIRIDVDAQTDMTWIVINDPIPGGSTILGTGLGRDSEIAVNTPTESSSRVDNVYGWWNRPWLSYQESAQDGFRAYYEYVPKGQFSIEYTVRLNNEGTFILPPTRVEALYAPEMFGELPNASVSIQAMP